MYFQDKANQAKNQSVNKSFSSWSTATTEKKVLLIIDKINLIDTLEALSIKKLVFDKLSEFIAKNGLI